jgi:hypothetical protein
MLQLQTLPPSLAGLVWAFRSCFTAPTFRTFAALLAGMIAQPGRRTVCGMLVAAGLCRVWHHSRAHWFFSRARWQPIQLSAVLARLVVQRCVPAGTPVLIAVDDTLFHRSGRRVADAAWFHDGAAGLPRGARGAIGFGHNWVIAGIVVRLPMLSRPICLPVAMALVTQPGRRGKPARTGAGRVRDTNLHDSRQLLACQLIAAIHTALAQSHPDRPVHMVADCWYAGADGAQGAAAGAARGRGLPAGVTLTSRLRANAALCAIAEPVPGRRGPRKVRGDKIGTPEDLARHTTATNAWQPATVTRYGHTEHIQITDRRCLWYGVYRSRTIRVILIRSTTTKTSYEIALISTDLHTPTTHLIERYAARWSIEIAIEDAKQHTGAGQAQNRTRTAVHRTVPFTLITQTIVVLWYAEHGHHPDIITQRRANAPWYPTKTEPSYQDMLTTARRTLITARILGTTPTTPTPQELHTIRLAWAQDAA